MVSLFMYWQAEYMSRGAFELCLLSLSKYVLSF